MWESPQGGYNGLIKYAELIDGEFSLEPYEIEHPYGPFNLHSLSLQSPNKRLLGMSQALRRPHYQNYEKFVYISPAPVNAVVEGRIYHPSAVSLYAYPVPFNGSCFISVNLPKPAYSRVNVFDVNGRLIKSLSENILPAGGSSFAWDGRDYMGKAVVSGSYFRVC